MDEEIAVTIVTKFNVMAIDQSGYKAEYLTEEQCEAVVRRHQLRYEAEAISSIADCIEAVLADEEAKNEG